MPLESLAWSSAQYLRDREPEEIHPTHTRIEVRKPEKIEHERSRFEEHERSKNSELHEAPSWQSTQYIPPTREEAEKLQETHRTVPRDENQWQARPKESYETTTQVYERREPVTSHDKLAKWAFIG